MSKTMKLEAILMEEKRVLMTGDYSKLSELVQRKEALLDELDVSGLNRATLERLSELCLRNEDLLRAAARGFKAAISQLRDIREGHLKSTYSKGGERQVLSDGSASVERKV